MARKTKIQSGDTLSGIARREKTTIPELLRLNPNIKNPDLIFSGANLNLPDLANNQTPIAGTAPSPTTTGGSTPSPLSGGSSPLASVVSERSGQKSERDKFLERLTSAFQSREEFDPVARRSELEGERGVSEKRENIATFDQEINTTLDLLDSLEGDLKERSGEFLVADPSFRRILASERTPLTKELSTLERGRTAESAALQGDITDIERLLGTEETAANAPLSSLFEETQLRATIDELFPDQGTDKVAPIIGALDQGIEDPVEIFKALRAEGINDIGINDIVDTITKVQSLQGEEDAFTLSEGQIRFDAEGNVIARGAPKSDGTGTGTGGSTDPTIQSWVNRIAQGSAKVTNVPQSIRNTVVRQLDAQGVIELTDTQRNTVNSLDTALTIVTSQLIPQFEKLSDQFADTAFERLTKGLPLAGEAIAQSDPDAATYLAFKEGILSTLARATGERGVLTNQDVGRARRLIPKLTDTEEVARKKLAQLEELFTDFQERAVGTFSKEFKGTGNAEVTVDSGVTSSGIKFTIENP